MKTIENTCKALAALGFSITCSGPLGAVDGDWPHIAYTCALSLNGSQIWSGTYRLGVGHIAIPQDPWSSPMTAGLPIELKSVLGLMKSGRTPKDKALQARACAELAKRQKVTPKLSDVLNSLLRDADSTGESFEDWCANMGYDSDSRKAESIYHACREVARQINRIPKDVAASARGILADY